jgi:hypothetical protein
MSPAKVLEGIIAVISATRVLGSISPALGNDILEGRCNANKIQVYRVRQEL